MLVFLGVTIGGLVSALSVLTDECDPDDLKPVNINEILAMAAKAEPDMITLFTELLKKI